MRGRSTGKSANPNKALIDPSLPAYLRLRPHMLHNQREVALLSGGRVEEAAPRVQLGRGGGGGQQQGQALE